MIEMEMSKDIKDFEPKMVGPFTMRQLICMGISAAYGIPLALWLVNTNMDIVTALTIVAIAMAPPIACGYVKLFGLYLDQFVFKCVIPMLLSPAKRKYKAKTAFSYIDPEKDKFTTDPKANIPKKMTRKEKKARELAYKKYEATR